MKSTVSVDTITVGSTGEELRLAELNADEHNVYCPSDKMGSWNYRDEHQQFRRDFRELTRELSGYRNSLDASPNAVALVDEIRQRSEFLDTYLWPATQQVLSDIREAQSCSARAQHLDRLGTLARAVKFFHEHIPDWNNSALEILINYNLQYFLAPTPTSQAAPAQ